MLDTTGEPRPEYRYHLLRVASERFKCDLSALDADRMAEAQRQARRTYELETLVLGSPEAQGVLIPPERVDAAVEELMGRYEDADAFEQDLARNGLDLRVLREALRRELAFDAVDAAGGRPPGGCRRAGRAAFLRAAPGAFHRSRSGARSAIS